MDYKSGHSSMIPVASLTRVANVPWFAGRADTIEASEGNCCFPTFDCESPCYATGYVLVADILVEAGIGSEKSTNVVHRAVIQDLVHSQCDPGER